MYHVIPCFFRPCYNEVKVFVCYFYLWYLNAAGWWNLPSRRARTIQYKDTISPVQGFPTRRWGLLFKMEFLHNRDIIHMLNQPPSGGKYFGVFASPGHQHAWCSSTFAHTVRFNSLCSGDTIWRHRSESTLAQVMACCFTAPSHHLNQCWLPVSEVLWHSPESNFTATAATL